MEDKGPEQPAAAANDKGPEQPANDKGPEQPANDNGPQQPANDKGPEQPAEAANDFAEADKDFEASRHIPQTETARRHFRHHYPHGYPDDEDFVEHPHYLKSVRVSISGYQSVLYVSASRDQVWRVKMYGRTVGRYHKLAEACEVAYWQHKQARQMKEFDQADTIPSAMFEGEVEEFGPAHRL